MKSVSTFIITLLVFGFMFLALPETGYSGGGGMPMRIVEVPTLSEWGLIAMAGILGIVGYMFIRRRKVVA